MFMLKLNLSTCHQKTLGIERQTQMCPFKIQFWKQLPFQDWAFRFWSISHQYQSSCLCWTCVYPDTLQSSCLRWTSEYVSNKIRNRKTNSNVAWLRLSFESHWHLRLSFWLSFLLLINIPIGAPDVLQSSCLSPTFDYVIKKNSSNRKTN